MANLPTWELKEATLSKLEIQYINNIYKLQRSKRKFEYF